jgi:predicted ATP-dependent endonuclease of OLD family
LILDFVNVEKLNEKVNNQQFLIKYFDAKRLSQPKNPTGINKITLKERYTIEENANSDFLQYIVNMKADRSFARDEGKHNEAQAIDNWFNQFENRLKFIFNAPSLKLEFDRQNYNFKIIEEGKEPYDLTTLSDGYSAVMSIVTELILRMEALNAKAYDIEGIVLIDEIETHLHVDLQKKILPFLSDFFPKIQFIVTTHSPFVINSVSNAVVCDLEKRIVTEDLSTYSYEAVIESYFGVDMYSEEVKQKVKRYEELSLKEQLNENEHSELGRLEFYFEATPRFLSRELTVKIQEICYLRCITEQQKERQKKLKISKKHC